MKKLLFVFVIVLAVVLIAGCNARRDNAEFETGDTTTVITPLDGEDAETIDALADDGEEASGELTVTAPEDGSLTTNVGYYLVKGTAPTNAHSIIVNGYTLQKYRPGQTEWRYIASMGIGTLQEGGNDYTVRALDKAGDEIADATFSIAYEPAAVPNLPDTGSSLWIAVLAALTGAFAWLGLKRVSL